MITATALERHLMNQFEALPLNDYHLQENRIDIWQFSLAELPSRVILSREEELQSQRFYFEKHRRRFKVSHTITRVVLAHYLKIDAAELVFSFNNYGKPHILNGDQLEFNLSHSGDLALLGVGKKPLGVDVEFFSPRPYQGIGENLFSSGEMKFFLQLADFLKPLGFFALWTQKEALVKACGMGLSYPTTAFSVTAPLQKESQVFDPVYQINWKIMSFMPAIACSAALCCLPSISVVRKRHVFNLDELF